MRRITFIGLVVTVVLAVATLPLLSKLGNNFIGDTNPVNIITTNDVSNPNTPSFEKIPVSLAASTSITLNVLENGDDSEENLANGVVDRWSSDLELTYDAPNSATQIVGLRYEGLTIPQGSTIESAYIDFQCDETSSGATDLTFWLEDIDNAGNLTSNNYDLSNRTKTSSSVDWNNVPAWTTAGNIYSTPDLANIIQEVIDRSGWISGNAITVLIEGTGSRTAENSNNGAASLHITFTETGNTETCYAIAQGGNAGTGGNAQLYSWQPNGVNTHIGATGASEIETMTMNGSCNEVHVIDGNQYGIIDTTTGNFTATFTLTTMEANGVNENINDVDGLAIDDNTGYVWAIERKVPGNDLLFQINPETGRVVEDIFGVGIDFVQLVGALEDVDDIAYNPCTDELYGVSTVSGSTTDYDQIVLINTTTGVLTVAATLTNCDIEGLTFNNNCELFGTTGYQDCISSNSVFSIDLVNETSTLISTFGHTDVEAVICCVTAPVPTCNNFTAPGTIGTSQLICDGSDMPLIQSLTNPSGGVGATDVVWMSSTTTTSPPSDITDPNWNIISGANTLAYDPGIISSNISYVRLVKRDNCTSPYLISNVVTMTVQDCGSCTTISTSTIGTDDAEEDLATGVVNLYSSDLELSEDFTNGEDQIIGIRFPNLTIPQGSTISSAYIEFEVDETSTIPTNLTFWAEDIDDAPTFNATTNNISSRTKTTASVNWNNVSPWEEVDVKHNSAGLMPIIQEVTDRAGWASGNGIVILIEGTGTRTAESYNGENAAAPKIYVTYCDNPTQDLGGRIFEDINYGGGDGRSYSESNTSAQSSGWSSDDIGVNNAVVELYDNTGNYITNTTTDSGGNYTFSDLSAGDYQVRVVNGSVGSNRGSNSTGKTIIPVQTFRSNSTQDFVNEVGGTNPSLIDATQNTSSSNLSSMTSGSTVAQSVTSVNIGSANVDGVDFGYNFNTVVNTNDAGQGSLRQFILNSNELDNSNLDQEDSPINGVSFTKDSEWETSIFMIPGTGVHIINPLSAYANITDPKTQLTGYTQQGSSQGTNANRVLKIELDGNTNLYRGISIYSDDTQVSGMSIHDFQTSIYSYKNGTTNTHIWGNYIGTAADGITIDPGFSGTGVTLYNVNASFVGTNADNVNDANEGNVVSNSYDGIVLRNTSDVLVAGNFVGIDKTGTVDLGNRYKGIFLRDPVGPNVIGFDDNAINTNGSELRNISSGNGNDGIRISSGDDQVIAGNYLGTDVTGAIAIKNNNYGIQVQGVVNNLIVGTDSDGDNDAQERNIISGNGTGMRFLTGTTGSNNKVSGNFIGTDPSGNVAIPNENNGLDISGPIGGIVVGTNADGTNDGIEGNVIAGNTEDGIRLSDTDNNIIAGNNIGVAYNGSPLGNGKRGVLIATSSANNIIGYSSTMTNSDELVVGNNIKYNMGTGLGLSGTGTENRISRNQFDSNGSLGIDLGYDGVTANDNGDTDSGPNDLLNFPVLESAVITGSNIIISGYAPANSEIEFFIADGGPNPSPLPGSYTKNFGEGAEYLFTAFEGGASDSDGSVGSYTDDGTGATTTKTQNKFLITIPVAGLNLATGVEITATATDSNNSTSEFSGWTQIYTCNNVTNPGQIGNAQTSCDTFDPNFITSVQNASGGNGNLQYIWMETTSSCGTPPTGHTDPNWNIITGAISNDYNPDSIDTTTCYVRLVKRDGCSDYIVSNIITLEVQSPGLTCELIGEPTNVSCHKGHNGSFTVQASGGEPPYEYRLNGDWTTNNVFTGLNNGVYDVDVRDSNGCFAYDCTIVDITEPESHLYCEILEINHASCDGASNGSVRVKGHQGTAPYLYSINGGSFVADSVFTSLAAGDYTVSIKDASDCEVDCNTVTIETQTSVCYPGAITNANPACDFGLIENVEDASSICNILQNHEFDEEEIWGIWANTGSAATMAYDNTSQLSGPNSAFIDITSTSGTHWHIAFTQRYLEIENGKTYEIKFNAKSTASRTISVILQMDGAPYTTYISETITIGTSNETYTLPSYTATIDDPDVKLFFGLGSSTDNVWIDKVVMGETNTSSVGYQWQQRESDGAGGWTSWTDIAGATSDSYDPPIPNIITQIRRRANIATCGSWENSNEIELIPPPTISAGDDVTICEGESTTLLATATYSNGTVSYDWDNNLGNGESHLVSPTTTTNYTVTVSDDADCDVTDVVTVTVINNFNDAGTISGDESGCESYDPSLITSTTPPTGGTGGSFIYSWEERLYDCTTETYGSWIEIAGATSDTYDPPVINESVEYRRKARRSNCFDWIIGNTVTKEVVDEYTAGGSIDGDETMCGAFDPASITNLADPSGGCGGIEAIRWYKWERDCANGNWITPGVSISGANDLTYDPPAISVTTRYRRYARRSATCPGTNGVWVVSNFVYKTVEEDISDPGTISSDETNCGPFDPSNITGTVATGGCFTQTSEYIWQYREGISGSFINIDGTNTVDYDPTSITTTTQYRRAVRYNNCPWAYSNIITKTVFDIPSVTVNLPNTEICINEVAINLTGGSPTSGTNSYAGPGVTGIEFDPNIAGIGTHTITYTHTDFNGCSNSATDDIEVLSSPTAAAGNDVDICEGQDVQLNATGGTGYVWSPSTGLSDANIANPIASPITTTTYTVTVTNADGCTNTDDIIVTVSPLANISVSSDQTICDKSTASLTSTITGGSGTVNYQWQKSVNAGNNWSDISGATSNTYTTPNLNATTYYRLKTTWSQSACTEQTSNMVTVTVELSSVVANVVATSDTLCLGESTVLTVNDGIQTGGLIDYSNWAAGAGSTTGYSMIGTANENNRFNDTNPWGQTTMVWEAGNDVESNADGGWNSSRFPIDNSKTYRYSVWLNRKIVGNNGRAYLGFRGYGSVNGAIRLSNGTATSNPYLWTSTDPPSTFGEDQWVLIVGHVFPSTHTGTTFHVDSGKYTLCDGKIGNTTADFKWLPETNESLHRNYLFYSTDTDVRQQFVYPRVDIIDGTEPSIDELLNGLDQTGGLGAGASYEWYTGSCGGTLVGTGETLPVTPTATTTYYVRAIGTCNTTDCEEITITVNDPEVTLNDPTDQCISGTDMSFNATPIPGTTSGDAGVYSTLTGLTDNGDGTATLDLDVAGAGSYDITYTYTDANGCTDAKTSSVTIYADPVVTLSLSDPDVCVGEGIITLAGGSPANGTYSGPGVSGDTFDPDVAGIGVHSITYTFIDDITGCSDTATDDIEVLSTPTVSLSLNEYVACITTANINLNGGSPSGGTFTGTGVVTANNTFDPGVAGVGAHKITYSFYDSDGCGGEAYQYIIVNDLPEVVLTDETICSNDTITLDPQVCEPYVDIVAQRPLLTAGWANVFGVGGTGLIGDGELCFTLDDANLTSANMIGLNSDPYSSNNYASMDFAIYVLIRHNHANPYLMQIREDGVSQANPYNSTISYVGSTFCIRRTGTTIEYLLDGTVMYTSAKSSTGTLNYDHSIHSGDGIYTGGYSKFTDISLCGDLDYNYLWSTGATTDTIDVFTANTYSVDITDVNGCNQTAQSIVTVNGVNNPSATVDGTITCENTSVQLTALPAGITYTWNGPNNYVSSSRTPTVNVPGVYDLTIFDFNNGCYEYLSVEVLLESQGAITNVTAGCTDEDIVIDYTIDGTEPQAWIGLYEVGGADGDHIDWSWVPTIPGSGTVTFTDHDLAGGTYEARLYSTDLYVLCESEQFDINSTPEITLSSDGGFTCEDSDVQLTALPTGQMYLWNGPNNFVSSSRTPNVYEAGMYVVTVTDIFSLCNAVDSIEVILESAGSIDLIESSCNHDVITVDYTIEGSESQAWIGIYNPAADNNDYLLQSSVPTIPGSGTVEFTDHGLAAGDYEARLFSTTGHILCENEVFTFGQQPECLITGRALVEENTQNEVYTGAPNMSYAWSVISGDANIDGVTNGQNVTIDFGSSNSTLQLTITSTQGCTSTCTIDIEMSPAGQCSFRDEFILQAFDNSDGTEDWASNSWTEIGDDGDPIGGDIVFVSQKLRFDNDDATLPSIERDIDLSTIANAVLSFNYNQGSGDLESDDVIQVQIYDGTSWHIVLSDTGNIPPNSSPTIDISMHTHADSKIKINIASGYSDASEYVFFDNVMITGDCIVPEICDDGIDNDFDGLTDCEDPDCSSYVQCVCQTIITNRHIYYKTTTTN